MRRGGSSGSIPVTRTRSRRRGALLVDVRSEVRRARDGIVPGALHVPLTVFPWRFDPDGLWRSPWVPTTDARVIVFCDDGFSSILAAATLAQLGYARAADVVGGFTAWRESGLPFAPAPGAECTTVLARACGPPDLTLRLARPRACLLRLTD